MNGGFSQWGSTGLRVRNSNLDGASGPPFEKRKESALSEVEGVGQPQLGSCKDGPVRLLVIPTPFNGFQQYEARKRDVPWQLLIILTASNSI